jgi:squalene-hopene/tetraprenyl-beta-curcumene cyclase
MNQLDQARLRRAYETARAALLAERTPEGHWVGELSTSALSTAVAVSALALVEKRGRTSFSALVAGGLDWLASHQNADGGWGDTVRSFSNISTTLLCRSAFHLCGAAERYPEALDKSADWLALHHGRTPGEIAEAVRRRYGKDRTFSVPILMTCALAGLVEWREVPALPFEGACLPQSWYRWLGFPVVSYALPALIAIGQAVFHHRPPRNLLVWLVRRLARRRTLRVLQGIQPVNGGFLEAAPLTGFVTLGLASSGQVEHPVVHKAVEFLVNSMRPDGSWPIDTNLATWVTTLAVNALAAAGDLESLDRKGALLSWLLKQQFLQRHPYTGADPGGWAWTDLPGGVPDCDDTPGTLLCIRHLAGPGVADAVEDFTRRVFGPLRWDDMEYWRPLGARKEEVGQPAFHALCGLAWVRSLQNADGGWPTFCRGWGKLPFDRSGSDLTAHALRALRAWVQQSVATGVVEIVNEGVNLGASIPTPRTFQRVADQGLAYLARQQRPDGSWLPLWFGNQHAPDDINPTYGTARVLAAYRDLGLFDHEPARRGIAYLIATQNADGGWGGAAGTPSSIEETALAIEALLDAPKTVACQAVQRGLAWLVEQVEQGRLAEATPIGFYFAKLWYFEKMYPIVFAVAALGRAIRRAASSGQEAHRSPPGGPSGAVVT